MIRFDTFKIGNSDENRDYNRKLLSDGVVAIECTDVRHATPGETIDYLQFCPWGTFFGTVEEYSNGARNFFVKNDKGECAGVLRTRPLDIGFKV